MFGYGLDAKEVEALKDKGRFGDRARAKLGKLTQQVSPTTRYRATVRQLMDDIEGERDKKKKDALREKLNRVLDGEELDVNDTVGELLPRTPGKKSVTDKL